MSTPHVCDTSFVRLLRRDRGAWWRVVVASVLGLAGLVVASILVALVMVAVARLFGHRLSFSSADGTSAAELFAANASLAALIPVAGGLVLLLYRVSPRELSSVRPGLRWTWLGRTAVVAALVSSPLFLLALASAVILRADPLDLGVVGFAVVVVLTTPFQAAGEEYLFRGLLLQGLGATRLPAWVCYCLSGGIFAAAHLQFAPPVFADRFVLGVALAWLAGRTGGLEAGIAIHTAKNIAVLIPAGVLGEVGSALDPSGASWAPLVLDVITLAVFIGWIVAEQRRRWPVIRPGLPVGWAPPPARG